MLAKLTPASLICMIAGGRAPRKPNALDKKSVVTMSAIKERDMVRRLEDPMPPSLSSTAASTLG